MNSELYKGTIWIISQPSILVDSSSEVFHRFFHMTRIVGELNDVEIGPERVNHLITEEVFDDGKEYSCHRFVFISHPSIGTRNSFAEMLHAGIK